MAWSLASYRRKQRIGLSQAPEQIYGELWDTQGAWAEGILYCRIIITLKAGALFCAGIGREQGWALFWLLAGRVAKHIRFQLRIVGMREQDRVAALDRVGPQGGSLRGKGWDAGIFMPYSSLSLLWGRIWLHTGLPHYCLFSIPAHLCCIKTPKLISPTASVFLLPHQITGAQGLSDLYLVTTVILLHLPTLLVPLLPCILCRWWLLF